jgi:hypothetical protein
MTPLAGTRRKPAFLIGLLAGALAAQNTQPSFENDQAIVNAPHPNVDVPGSTHKAHDHKLNRVMVYMHPGGEYLHYLDGRTVDLKWQAGEVQWSPASGMHYSEGKPDTPPFTGPMIVDIGIKKPGITGQTASPALDALQVDPRHWTLEIENSQVRVLRVRLGPRESTPTAEWALNRLVVCITDANVRETSAGGKAEVIQQKAAEFRWSGPAKQQLENLSDKPFEAVIVEFRN